MYKTCLNVSVEEHQLSWYILLLNSKLLQHLYYSSNVTLFQLVAQDAVVDAGTAKCMADYHCRLLQNYYKTMYIGEGPVFQSPYILECRLRKNVEVHEEKAE